MNTSVREKIDSIANSYPSRISALIPALDLAQRDNGNHLSAEMIQEVATQIGVTEGKAFGVATFYTMFNTKPIGKFHIQVDVNIPAFLAGSDKILNHLKTSLGIKPGETTSDGLFTLTEVQDLGSCGTCPVVQINDIYYENMTTEKIDKIIAELRKGKVPEKVDESVFASECNVLLKNRGNKKATDLAVYQKNGGYEALKKALTIEPAEIVSMVKDAQLRGRGGAGFPTGLKWSFLPKNNTKPVYLICNADEGEPGTFKDRQIMEYDPHLLIEGIAISAYAIGSKKSFIYIRGEFRWIADILEKAVKQAKDAGLLKHVEIIVHKGAGSYVCGDETALMESLEGNRGNPRLKPPFPAIQGLYGCPTIINNVESLALVPVIIEKGADEFKKIGTVGNYGPKIYGVSGHVNKPGAFEFPLGTPLKKILDAAGGVKGKIKGVIVGGLSVPILTASEINELKMDYDSCQKAGTMLGSGGIMVINDTVSIPEVAYRTIEFYAHESCGQCTPCREGSSTVKALIKRILHGNGSKSDIDTILKMCGKIKGLTLCPLGDAFAMPIEAMVQKFRHEFEALIK
ncbi:MAG: NADH-quinone oxidoreductase subunit NuoF [Candidatus Riflebacteria bacterium]|nr:NADH-quinone oxidoreductase subunit NuoF [Candidatus Riflebacteria bacterium]